VQYINTQLQYYNICAEPDLLTDYEWALKYAILEDIRQNEKRILDELGQLHLSD